MIQPTKEEITKRTLELIDEKYDWLEQRKAECKKDKTPFELQIEIESWISIKLAQHEITMLKNL